MSIKTFGVVLVAAIVTSACSARKIPVAEIRTPRDVVEATSAGVISGDVSYLHQIASEEAVEYLINEENRSAFLKQLSDLELTSSSLSFSRVFADGIRVVEVSSSPTHSKNSSNDRVAKTFAVTLHKACNVSNGNPALGAPPIMKPCGPAIYKFEVVCSPHSIPAVKATKSLCQLEGISQTRL